MINILGWIGLGLLIIAYIFIYINKYNLFYLTNIVASGTLTVYAILLGDIVFSIVNGFITLVIFKKIIT